MECVELVSGGPEPRHIEELVENSSVHSWLMPWCRLDLII